MAYKHNISSNLGAAKISYSLEVAFPVVVYAALLEQYKQEWSIVVTMLEFDVTSYKFLLDILKKKSS